MRVFARTLLRGISAALPALLLLTAAGCGAAQGERESDADLIADVERYRHERIEDLKKPDSWLTLAGLYWLREGENTFGSDASNDVVFPEGTAPAHIGTFTRTGGSVRVRIEHGVEVLHEGQPVDTLTLASDAGEAPTVLRLGTLSWYLIERDGRLGIRLKDSQNPALLAFEGIDTFPIDLAWRRTARFEPYDPPKIIPILNVTGTISQETAPGAVVFDAGGQSYRLDVTGAPGDSAFFVIFGDQTNGEETYDAGRYLWVDAPDADGRLVIDFNKAYNPPCVFTPYATCPLPPRQNRLPLRVEAGEQTYGKH